MGASSGDLGQHMVEERVENGESVLHGTRRARQIDYERASDQTRDTAAEHRMRRRRCSAGSDRIGDPRHVDVEQCCRRLGGRVGGGYTGATC